jgi:acyl dehydratase
MSVPDDVTIGDEWAVARITDEKLAAARARIGKVRREPGWNSVVTNDTIRHFALGVGDDNPLFWDEAYGAKSPRGQLTAPPGYLYSHINGPVLNPDEAEDLILPDVLALWAGERWRWRRHVHVGEAIHCELTLVEITPHEGGAFGGRSVTQRSKLEFKTETGEIVADILKTQKRFERAETRARGKYLDRPLAKYTQEDRDRFEAHYRKEAQEMRRGDRPRYLEDTRIGEKTPTMLKGPLSRNNLIGWSLGCGLGLAATNRMLYTILDNTPGIRMVNPDSGVTDTWASPHWEAAFCNAAGIPGEGYDHGCQRLSWVSHFVSDWMGDHAFLRELEIRLMRPNIVNDIQWLNGEVVAIDPLAGNVTLDITTTNQLDEITSRSRAVVELPRA